ncbi:MAG TPA: glycosyltransferase [Solirubrobacteraceae bacterium]|nr:glycosyltransferase [Solirubrobacteraceae bacterium]
MPWGERLGGAETMLQTLLDGARESGHELEVVFLEPGPWPEQLQAAGTHVEVVCAGRLREPHRWVLAVARLARTFRRRRPDLIVSWSAKTQLYGAPAAVLAGMRGRVLWWQHAIPTRGWLDSIATMLPTIAVGCTSQTAADAQRVMFPRRRTFVVAAGVPVPSLEEPPLVDDAPAEGQSAAALRPPPGVPVVGLVGRLEPWKGQDRLLHAQRLLHERGHRIHTLIVGGDAYALSTVYAESLPALAARLGLAREVTLTGQVPDAGPYIRRMDILVNASDPEPFGIVMLEGMARGVAVVGVNGGGAAEIIEDRRTGVLARSGEPVALADALEALLSSPELRASVASEGRERFLREFTDVAMSERFFARMRELIEVRDG